MREGLGYEKVGTRAVIVIEVYERWLGIIHQSLQTYSPTLHA